MDKELRLGLLTAFCITLILSLKTMSLDSSFLNFDENFLSGLKLIWGHFFTAFSFITTNGYISSYWGGTLPFEDTPHITVIFLGLCLFGGGLATTAGA